MHTITYLQPEDGFRQALILLRSHGIEEDSRVGRVLRLPTPLLLESKNPRNFLVRCPIRRVNPFFSIYETLWMLAGSDELAPLIPYNRDFGRYSDDGTTVRGSAYGYRWRQHFGYDQLMEVVSLLKREPNSRRAVLTMWDASTDPITDSKDLPCNTQIYFSVVEEKLNMIVVNRSNDLVYGTFGSNICHFSLLLILMAGWLDLRVGSYYQFTANAHVYLGNPVARRCLNNVDSIEGVTDEPLKFPVLPQPMLFYKKALEAGSAVVPFVDMLLRFCSIYPAYKKLEKSQRAHFLNEQLEGIPTYLATAARLFLRNSLDGGKCEEE